MGVGGGGGGGGVRGYRNYIQFTKLESSSPIYNLLQHFYVLIRICYSNYKNKLKKVKF